MAYSLPARLLQRSASPVKVLVNHTRRLSPSSAAPGESMIGGLTPTLPSSTSPISGRRSLFSPASRLGKALSCGESLMPLHSVTASVLLKSMLASEVGQWGCLSEGFATPL